MERPELRLGAIVLAGGTAVRMGGVDKASIEWRGRTLLEYALDAVTDAAEVVVVGAWVPTERPVTFTREDPVQGGPAAGVLAGLDAFAGVPRHVVLLAVDMPRVTMTTIDRLRDAAEGRDGAVLVDAHGRRALAYVVARAALEAARPEPEAAYGMSLRALLGELDLAAVPARDDEAHDIDSWDDLA